MIAFGACFAAANAMYARISARAHEVGTLRALGFQRRSIVGCLFLEAVLLGLLASSFGALLSLPLNAIQTGTMNQVTFSEVTFQLRTTPEAIFSEPRVHEKVQKRTEREREFHESSVRLGTVATSCT